MVSYAHLFAIWFLSLVKYEVRRTCHPHDYDGYIAFTTICINPGKYLNYLYTTCERLGIVFKRAAILHITESVRLHSSVSPADLVVNCSGLGAATLGGVGDMDVYPHGVSISLSSIARTALSLTRSLVIEKRVH